MFSEIKRLEYASLGCCQSWFQYKALSILEETILLSPNRIFCLCGYQGTDVKSSTVYLLCTSICFELRASHHEVVPTQHKGKFCVFWLSFSSRVDWWKQGEIRKLRDLKHARHMTGTKLFLMHHMLCKMISTLIWSVN